MRLNDDLRLIVLDNIKDFGSSVHKHIQNKRKTKQNYLIPTDLVRFSNGEGKVKLQASVREKDVFILSDISNHNITYKIFGIDTIMTPDEHFQDIKRAISAIRGNASRITVIMPILYQARQHARNGRESLDCAIALQELEKMGVHNIITFDAHDPNVQNAIPLLPFDNFFPTNTILTKFIENEDIDYDKLLVISPDEGAMKRSRYYASMLGVDIGLFYKRRDYSIVVDGKNPIVEHKYLGKEEEGLDYVIIDDMIATGGSILDILNEIKKKKPRNVYMIATFGFFTEGPNNFDKAYKEGLLKKVYSTNLCYISEEIRKKEWFCEIDCSKYLADIIDAYSNRKSLSPLFNGKKEMFEKIIKDKAEQKKQ